MKLKLSYPITIYLIVLFVIVYTYSNLESLQHYAFGFVSYLILISIAYYFFSRYSCKLNIDERMRFTHIIWRLTIANIIPDGDIYYLGADNLMNLK